MKIIFTKQKIELKNSFTSVRSSITNKEFGFIKIIADNYFGIGELSPIHSFGENIFNCSEQVNSIIHSIARLNPNQISDWLKLNSKNYFPSVLHAFESALLDFLSKQNNESLYVFLKVPSPNGSKSCITIPINYSPLQIDNLIKQFPKSTIKIKLSNNNSEDIERIKFVSRLTNSPFWIDAEGVFKSAEDCIQFLNKIGKEKILILEDPLSFEPNQEWTILKDHAELYVDRFFTKKESLANYIPFVDGFNIKPVRFGGLINSLNIITHLKMEKKKIILGCLLETGVNISNSFSLAGLADYIDLDGYTYFTEVPYNGIQWNENGMSYLNVFGNGIK